MAAYKTIPPLRLKQYRFNRERKKQKAIKIAGL
jgi:hypothetical protein